MKNNYEEFHQAVLQALTEAVEGLNEAILADPEEMKNQAANILNATKASWDMSPDLVVTR